MLAHELSHVRNRDTLISAIAATLAGVILMVARMAQFAAHLRRHAARRARRRRRALELLVMIIVAPLAATLIQLAISRSREYEADATGRAHLAQPGVARVGAREDRRRLRSHPAAGRARRPRTSGS